MQIKCGIDIIEISRIKESIEDDTGDKFIKRVYTQKEIEYCESKKNVKYQHYAARFAAKEAFFKAISECFPKYEITWQDIEITNDINGRPKVELLKNAISNIESIDISLSHCKEYAVANVTILYY
jgi:holo-[acyl-carrier protein] synthase